MMVVIMCVSCQLSTLFIFTNDYQEAVPYQNHHATGRFRRLPNITGSCARGAKPIGILGLVTPAITILYHGAILAGILPQGAFTKHHRLVTRTGTIRCYDVLDVLGVVGYELVPIYFTSRVGRVVTGLCE